jgi:hypothetical protein
MANQSTGQKDLPERFKSGQQLKASELEDMRRAIAFALKDMIGGGRGIVVSESSGRYLISATKKRNATKLVKHPFQILIVRDSDGEDDAIKFYYGTVNSSNVPTIGDPPEPITEEVDDDANPTIALPGTDKHFISLKVTIDASFIIDTVEIQAATTAPTDTTTEAYYRLATVDTEDGTITNVNQFWLTNATYFYAGDDKHLFFL